MEKTGALEQAAFDGILHNENLRRIVEGFVWIKQLFF
jgi:hypothetical protein